MLTELRKRVSEGFSLENPLLFHYTKLVFFVMYSTNVNEQNTKVDWYREKRVGKIRVLALSGGVWFFFPVYINLIRWWWRWWLSSPLISHNGIFSDVSQIFILVLPCNIFKNKVVMAFSFHVIVKLFFAHNNTIHDLKRKMSGKVWLSFSNYKCKEFLPVYEYKCCIHKMFCCAPPLACVPFKM